MAEGKCVANVTNYKTTTKHLLALHVQGQGEGKKKSVNLTFVYVSDSDTSVTIAPLKVWRAVDKIRHT